MNARVTLDTIVQAIDGLTAIRRKLEVGAQFKIENSCVDNGREENRTDAWPTIWFLRDSDSYGNDKD
jgi:hypothetical protein